MIEHIDRRLPHVAGALGRREEIRGRYIDRPVAVPEPERVQDVGRIDVILDGELRYVVGGIVPPPREQPVTVLVDDEGGEVVVLATVFPAVLPVLLGPRHAPRMAAGSEGKKAVPDGREEPWRQHAVGKPSCHRRRARAANRGPAK
jgi:hypothetical protein